MNKLGTILPIGFLLLLFCFSADASQFKQAQIKQLTTSGAITTNNKAGILDKIILSGTTAGDYCVVKNGTTEVLRLIVPANNGSVQYPQIPGDLDVIFNTDIDVTVSASGSVWITAQYREING